MSDCKRCREMEDEVMAARKDRDRLQELYDELYKGIDDAVFSIRKEVDDLNSLL